MKWQRIHLQMVFRFLVASVHFKHFNLYKFFLFFFYKKMERGFDSCVVFDFDQTLTQKHFYNTVYSRYNQQTGHVQSIRKTIISDQSTIIGIFGGEDRLRFICQFLNQIKDKADVMVSTHGFIEDIVEIFDNLGQWGYNISSQIFKLIHGRLIRNQQNSEVFDPRTRQALQKESPSYRKDSFIREQSKVYTRCVVFIDDDEPKNYYHKLVDLTNVFTITMKDEKGIDKYDVKEIYKVLKDRGGVTFAKIPYPSSGLREARDNFILSFLSSCVSCNTKKGAYLCGGCYKTMYCGVACQTNHWESHVCKK